MRSPSHQADSLELVATGAAALENFGEEMLLSGLPALARVLALDELAQPHLRRLTADLIGPGRKVAARAQDDWLAGERFLAALLSTYREAVALAEAGQIQRMQRVEWLIRRMRAAANLLHWRAYAYFPGGDPLWAEVVATYRCARDADLAWRQMPLKPGARSQTSLDREFVRAFALGSASLDQLSPDGIDIAERLIRYIVPTLSVSAARRAGAVYMLSIDRPAAPRRLLGAAPGENDEIFLLPSDAASVLDELASVITKGLVPAALASGEQARERVLSVIYHLRRLWSSAPHTRRHRRHALAGKLLAVRGFQYIRGELASSSGESLSHDPWTMVDVSLNGIGLVVPAEDCDRLAVGDMVGVRAEDGLSWHVGVVRRIVRSGDGSGIVGMQSIARSAVSALIDDGRNPADVLLLDPVRRGNAVRLARAIPQTVGNEAVFLNQDGRISKLRLISRMFRGEDFEVLNYQVL